MKLERGGYGDGKNERKEGLKVKNKGDMGLRQRKEVKREEIGRILVKN